MSVAISSTLSERCCTGCTRALLAPVAERARAEGYFPEVMLTLPEAIKLIDRW